MLFLNDLESETKEALYLPELRNIFRNIGRNLTEKGANLILPTVRLKAYYLSISPRPAEIPPPNPLDGRADLRPSTFSSSLSSELDAPLDRLLLSFCLLHFSFGFVV